MTKPDRVKEHYTNYDKAYADCYGEVIQTCKTDDPLEMLHYVGKKAQIKKGMWVLDCGGGYGAPAAFFKHQFGAVVTSLNITECQLEKARAYYPDVRHINLSFDNLERLHGNYDRVLFLESIGHTRDLKTLMEKVYAVMKTDGLLFIKHPSASRRTNTIREMESFYAYSFFGVMSMLTAALDAGFELESVGKTPYGEYNEELVSKFSTYTNGERCFLHPHDFDFSLLKYYDFVFRK